MKQNRKKEKILLITCILFHYIFYSLFYILSISCISFFKFTEMDLELLPAMDISLQERGEEKKKELKLKREELGMYLYVRSFFLRHFFFLFFILHDLWRTDVLYKIFYMIFDVSSYIVSFCKNILFCENILFDIQFKYFIVLYYFNIFFQYFISFYLLNII